MRLVEVRSYKLKDNTFNLFHQLFVEQSVPMLIKWGTDVVAFGPSPQQDDEYFLIRSYENLHDLNQRQNDFYSSEEWRNGPREAVVEKIENSSNTLFWLSKTGIEDLRASNR